jgi:hypothetical protein
MILFLSQVNMMGFLFLTLSDHFSDELICIDLANKLMGKGSSGQIC